MRLFISAPANFQDPEILKAYRRNRNNEGATGKTTEGKGKPNPDKAREGKPAEQEAATEQANA